MAKSTAKRRTKKQPSSASRKPAGRKAAGRKSAPAKAPPKRTKASPKRAAGGAATTRRPAPAKPAAVRKGKWVYGFGDGKAEGRPGMRNLLGGKGAGLAEMANLGLPVPPGFTITTEVCTHYYTNGNRYPADLEQQVKAALDQVGRITGKTFGDKTNPLLVSVRSGARASMPGMMDTVLNLGLNDETVEALAAKSGDQRFAYDSYRRFITMYSDVVLGVGHHHFEEILDDLKDRKGYSLDTDVTADDWVELVGALQGAGRGGARFAVPAGSARTVVGGDQRGVRLVDEPARHHVPPLARDPGKLGHRGQRPGHGVRQHG